MKINTNKLTGTSKIDGQSKIASLWYLIVGALCATGFLVALTYFFPRENDPYWNLIIPIFGMACASGIIVFMAKKRGEWGFAWQDIYTQVKLCAIAGTGIFAIAFIGMLLTQFPGDSGPIVGMIGVYMVIGSILVPVVSAVVFELHR